jgi:hypothetical protein
MAIVGAVVKIIQEENPRAIIIDKGGIGHGIYCRLREMYGANVIVGVNFAEKALRHDLYVNRRAEMWGNMKEWFRDEPVQIPDDDRLHAEIITVPFDASACDSSGKLKLVSKVKCVQMGYKVPMALTH